MGKWRFFVLSKASFDGEIRFVDRIKTWRDVLWDSVQAKFFYKAEGKSSVKGERHEKYPSSD